MAPTDRPPGRGRRQFLLAVILCAGAFLLLARSGEVSGTWDEQVDLGIVACLDSSGEPSACLADISQTRLPYYIHWMIGSPDERRSAHYLVSAAFALVNLLLVFLFARRRFGEAAALLAAALVATSPPMLASGRMLLSHSNVIFTTFTLLAVIAQDHFEQGGRGRFFWLSAVAFGLATASSLLGIFNGLLIAGFWFLGSRRPRAWQMAAYVVLATAVFFAATVIYVDPASFRALIDATLHGHAPGFWNYLGLGTNVAPPWYSFLLFAIKIGPWFALLFAVSPALLPRGEDGERHRLAFIIWAAFLLHLLLKSAIFRYDAPHQQAVWYPLVYMVIAAVLVDLAARARGWRPLMIGLIGVLLAVQIIDTVRFFPNYLFHGAQYGQRFIGEFYGPAVLHAQDRDEIDRAINDLVLADSSARFLMADNNAFGRSGPSFVPFTRRNPSRSYEYALVDRLYATHFRFPERDEYNSFLAEHYVPLVTHEFPLHEWAYRILKRK